ncbi:nitrate- and nitrite sensing domain-containing protein [Amycolatopsis sp. YIM 10]|uniref:nitrate- and nitrite sensing domain-containing protein n=1 Tax=Amycolatopsis sp. YIM 10 TaxID=2653857 RepID=UPI00128FECB8|nr:nitrate- and nitrite sensing domain-containing protein [Amycolatopsis sp. YIM 10]QFU86909.1 Globin-coupled histidine kinase [Amycolatopsis sp. YIM 10]
MKKHPTRRTSSIRSRVLAIALVPSIALLAVGIALSGYLVYDAVQVRDKANQVRDIERPAVLFFANFQEERRLSLKELASPGSERAALGPQRTKVDAAAQEVLSRLQAMSGDAAPDVQKNIVGAATQLGQLPQFRQQIDNGQPQLSEAYGYFNGIIDLFTDGLNGLAQDAPNAQIAFLRVIAVPLFSSADRMQRGDALAAAGVAGGGLTEADFRTYIGEIGAYRAELTGAVPRMPADVKAKYDQLLASPAWNTVTTVENAFLRGNQTVLPVAEQEWRTAARDVGSAMMGLFIQQSGQATTLAIDDADDTLLTSIIAAAVALLVAIAVFFFALRLSNRLIGRLALLREETLDMADTRLPELVDRVRAGEDVDLDNDVRFLDHGSDEIGQVAAAFNRAQQTAIAAAIDEAKTREGTKTVFLNIAHRSQVIVHRQLKVLDQAERKQEDPDQLDTLFQLDHLSTRARRNAENLIILGGGQPGRQWRKPVSLAAVVRGASAETEDFTRVGVAKLPQVAINGPVVGDLVHLLAELIDNATSFSPPESRVEIRGNVVGRGVVIEVEDQGLGIEPDHLAELNEMLTDPPDFGIMALSDEPRLGLFVVARLAVRHGIAVTLRESAYGGTRAIVLVRSELLGKLDEPEPEEDDVDVPRQQERRPLRRPEQPLLSTPPSSASLPPMPKLPQPPERPAPEATPPWPTESQANGRLPEPPPREREDLFRPRHQLLPQDPPPENGNRPPEVRRPAESRPPESRPAESRPPGDVRPQQPRRPGAAGPPPAAAAPGRPPLPQRRRQQNLVPQLRNDGPAEIDEQEWEEPADGAEQARNRLAAFQQGTRRAREQDLGRHDRYGERT